MFEQPIKGDLDRALSLLMHESHHKLLDECNDIKSQAATVGALQSNRIIISAAKAADTLHQEAMKQAAPMLLAFTERMQREPTVIIDWARPHLENLGNALLGCIPPNGFPTDHQRIRHQYHAVFQQRLNGMLRDVEIGYTKGAGFARAEQVESKKEWVSGVEAIQLLRPIMEAHVAQKTICTRAHSGLIRARAERFMVDNRVADGHEVPKDFWWAEGGAALQQNWTTGDFDTWIDRRVHLKAFGVSFLRGDIEKMIPAVPAKGALAGAPKGRRSAIILTALHVETRAVLRHLSDVREEPVRGTVFHVGQFDEWDVAVAECGEGNASAAATVERGIGHFHAEVALFVGVAGGVKDVAIGDALVSSKVYSYERGKDTEDGFKLRPLAHLSTYTLEQRARAIKHGEDWRRRLSSSLPHTNPQIYIGAIAAGEKVVASSAGKIAEFLKENYGDTLGVEMEGQGFLAGVHINAPVQGCVVRGISDLLDGKADADKAGSQEKAADVASAVAIEMLATLQPAGAERTSADTHGQLPDIRHEKNEEERRTDIARTYFAPELARIVARQIHILGRTVANFITASVGKYPLPGDSWASLKPWQPVLYPTAAEFRNLSATDATLLVKFYDSLQEITDIVNSWVDSQTTADVNAWNFLMQKVQHNLNIGQRAVEKFCPEIQYDATMPAAGTLLDRSERAISGAQAAMAAHLSRHGVS